MTLRELACRLGIHQWYLDSAFVVSAERCSHCNTWRDKMQGAAVERFRSMISSGHLKYQPPPPNPTSERPPW